MTTQTSISPKIETDETDFNFGFNTSSSEEVEWHPSISWDDFKD